MSLLSNLTIPGNFLDELTRTRRVAFPGKIFLVKVIFQVAFELVLQNLQFTATGVYNVLSAVKI